MGSDFTLESLQIQMMAAWTTVVAMELERSIWVRNVFRGLIIRPCKLGWSISVIQKREVTRIKPKFLAQSTEWMIIPFTTIVNTGEGVSWGRGR